MALPFRREAKTLEDVGALTIVLPNHHCSLYFHTALDDTPTWRFSPLWVLGATPFCRAEQPLMAASFEETLVPSFARKGAVGGKAAHPRLPITCCEGGKPSVVSCLSRDFSEASPQRPTRLVISMQRIAPGRGGLGEMGDGMHAGRWGRLRAVRDSEHPGRRAAPPDSLNTLSSPSV